MGPHRLAAKPVAGKGFSPERLPIAQSVRDKASLQSIAARFCSKQGEICFNQMTLLVILGAM
jgi:hypothetical protein